MAARETGLLTVVDDITINRSRRLDSEVYRSILCSVHIQPNTAKLIRRGFCSVTHKTHCKSEVFIAVFI